MLLFYFLFKLGNDPSFHSVDTYSCFLRLKSLPEEEAVRMQPGSGETHVL